MFVLEMLWMLIRNSAFRTPIRRQVATSRGFNARIIQREGLGLFLKREGKGGRGRRQGEAE